MTARRGRGEDSIYKDGLRWRGAIDLGYGPDGRRRHKKVSGATKAEVAKPRSTDELGGMSAS